jgi:hypothetical protein
MSQEADLDIAAAAIPKAAQVAGGVTIGAGVLGILVAFQTLTGFRVSLAYTLLLGLSAALGVAAIASGAALTRARPWAPAIAAVAAGVLGMSSGIWLVLSLGSGLISLFALGAPPIATIACVLAIVTIEPCKRVNAARSRLREQGLDLGH